MWIGMKSQINIFALDNLWSPRVIYPFQQRALFNYYNNNCSQSRSNIKIFPQILSTCKRVEVNWRKFAKVSCKKRRTRMTLFKPRAKSKTFHTTSYNFDVAWNVALVWPHCCIVLFVLYLVVWRLMEIKLFHQTNVRYISIVFRDVVWCCSRLAAHCNFVVLCCKYFRRNAVSCCTKCCIRLATPLLNTIKLYATMCNKCHMIF